MVYAAKIDGQRYTFQPSGSLWQDALVMQDLETKSLWSQPTGECIQGPMEGKVLNLHPAIHTTYREFKQQHPSGVLLRKESRGDPEAPYASYYADSTKLGIFGRLDDFERLPGKALVVGIRLADKDVAVSYEYLQDNRYADVLGAEQAVRVEYDPSSQTVSATDISDSALPEPPAYPVITSYWFAWISFFPETELITVEDDTETN